MDTLTTITIWATPAILGIASWALIELFKDVKEDVKDLKTSNSNIRTDIAKQGVQIKNLDDKVTAVCKSVDNVKGALHIIDKQQVGKDELEITMQAVKQIESRMNDSDKKYGQILMILDGMAKRIGINVKKSGS